MSIKRFVSALLTGALCLGVLTACGSTQKPASSGVSADAQRYSTIFYDAFDTVTQVIAYCDSEEEFSRQMDALHADLLEYHRLYDIYNDYDGVVNVKTINDNAGVAPVQVDDKILGMLELARQMYDTTNGKLNIAMGSVLRIWHDYREAAEANTNEADNKLPEQEALDAAARHCDISNLVIDENAKTVYLSDPDMSLDVGSVGKGYAVEMVAQAAEARGLKSALISVGGNLRAIGTKPDGSQWSGGVENPWNASDVYTASSSYVSGVNMSDMALVTSGNYQRYYVVDGVRYHHLIDPDTLWPARYFDSVSVLSPDSGAADCLTTGLFCMSLEDGQKLIESLDGVEASGVPRTAKSSSPADGPTTRKSNRKRKSPLRHSSCSNDEEGTFIYYISRMFPRVHSSIQAYFAIRTAPPVTSAVTSSTTQTDATALSRTDSESMTKWNRYALSRSFWDFLRMDWNTRIDRLRWSTTAMIRSTPPAKNVKLGVVHSAERAAAVSAALFASRVASCADMVPEFIITALAMLLIDATPHRSIASTPPCPAPYIKAFGKSIGFTRNLMAM